jgi:hypothetical protein
MANTKAGARAQRRRYRLLRQGPSLATSRAAAAVGLDASPGSLVAAGRREAILIDDAEHRAHAARRKINYAPARGDPSLTAPAGQGDDDIFCRSRRCCRRFHRRRRPRRSVALRRVRRAPVVHRAERATAVWLAVALAGLVSLARSPSLPTRTPSVARSSLFDPEPRCHRRLHFYLRCSATSCLRVRGSAPPRSWGSPSAHYPRRDDGAGDGVSQTLHRFIAPSSTPAPGDARRWPSVQPPHISVRDITVSTVPSTMSRRRDSRSSEGSTHLPPRRRPVARQDRTRARTRGLAHPGEDPVKAGLYAALPIEPERPRGGRDAVRARVRYTDEELAGQITYRLANRDDAASRAHPADRGTSGRHAADPRRP